MSQFSKIIFTIISIMSLAACQFNPISEEEAVKQGINKEFIKWKNQDLFNEELILPKVPTLIAPLIQLVIGQLFAYFTATSLKRNIDKPRSLAKSVTVG